MFRRPAIAVLCLAAVLLGPPAAAHALSFTQPPGSPFGNGGNGAIDIAAVDVNGDGHPDLLEPNNISHDLPVLLGDGTGGYAAAPGSPVATGGTTPVAVAVADFNGDGKPDAATANTSSNDVSVLLGDGLGGFSAAPGSPVPSGGVRPDGVVAADFDADGKLDLAVANANTADITVVLGDGTGRFTAASGSPFPAGGARPRSLAVADLNGDSKPDLLTPNADSNDLSILLGDGSGGFAPALGSPFATGGAGPEALAVGDLDFDGRPDVVVAHETSSDVSVLLGDGAGGVTPADGSPFSSGGSAAVEVTIGDLNSDSRPDLAIGNLFSGNVTLALGDGAGGFFGATTGSPLAGMSFAVAIQDLDSDGKPDVAVADGFANVTHVNLNTSPAPVDLSPAALTFPIQPRSTLSVPQTVTLTNPGPAPVHVGRVDLDGTNPDDFIVSPTAAAGRRSTPVTPAGCGCTSCRAGPARARPSSGSRATPRTACRTRSFCEARAGTCLRPARDARHARLPGDSRRTRC
jgi:FG-GAP-like repeat/FG-GAP repeat